MRKIFLTAMIVLLVVVFAGFGCGGGEEEEEQTQLLDCAVDLVEVSTVFVGQESCVVDLVFSIENPNSFTVDLDELDYTLYVNDLLLGAASCAEVYVPAKTEVKVRDAFVIPIAGVIGRLFMDGNPQEEAVKIAGGTFQAIGEGTAKWNITGSAHIDTRLGWLHAPLEKEL